MFLASGAPHEKLQPLELTHHQVMRKWPSEEDEGTQLDSHEREEKDRYLKGRALRSVDTVVQVWFDRMEELLRGQSADGFLDGGGGWERKKQSLKGAAATLARAMSGETEGTNGDGGGGGSGGEEGEQRSLLRAPNDIIVCSNGRCDNAAGFPGACVRQEGCEYDGWQQQMPDVLWRLMREKPRGLRFTGHPGKFQRPNF